MGTPMVLVDADGIETGVTANPLVVTGPGGGGSSDVEIVGPLGQALMAASIPVAIASNQSAIAENLTTIAGNSVVTAGVNGLLAVGGNVASGVADTGNPVKAAGVYTETPPTLVTGDRGNLLLDQRSNLRARMIAALVTGNDTVANAALSSVSFNSDVGTAASFRPLAVAPVVFDGTQWIRQRADTVANGGALIVRQGPFVLGRATADAQIKAGAGFIHTVTIGATGTVTAGVLTIYDSLTETGTVIFSVALPVTTFTPFSITLDLATSTGIYVGFDATLANVQATLSYR